VKKRQEKSTKGEESPRHENLFFGVSSHFVDFSWRFFTLCRFFLANLFFLGDLTLAILHGNVCSRVKQSGFEIVLRQKMFMESVRRQDQLLFTCRLW